LLLLHNSILNIYCISTDTCSNSTALSSGKKGSKTPSGGDRFIPVRSSTNFELGHYKVINILAFMKHTSYGYGP
jgi:hypothetical protein